jgi:hypothetical protein
VFFFRSGIKDIPENNPSKEAPEIIRIMFHPDAD